MGNCYSIKNISEIKQKDLKPVQINVQKKQKIKSNQGVFIKLYPNEKLNIPADTQVNTPLDTSVNTQVKKYQIIQKQKSQQPSLDLSSIKLTFEPQIVTFYHKCINSYQEHQIDKAYQYSQLIKSHNSQHQLLQFLGQEKLNDFQKMKKIIEMQYNDLLTYEGQILKGNWVEKQIQDGIKISCRREDDTVGVLIESIIDIPFEIFFCFLIQIDFYHEFMMYVQSSSQQKVVARNCRIGKSVNNLPIIARREAFFQGIGYNRLNHSSEELFMFTRSIHDRPDLQKHLGYDVITNKDYVQLSYKYFVLKYHPIKQKQGKVTIAMNIDPKIIFPIPFSILEITGVIFGRKFFQSIIDLANKFENSKWQKSVKKDPELFNFFKNCVNQYLNNKKINNLYK